MYCDKYVCLSVCPTGCLRNHTRDLYQIFMRVAHVRGSVLLQHIDDIPHRLSAGRDFLPIDNEHWSVCLPLLIFRCTIKSRSSLLAPAHPGGPGKRAVKRCGAVVVTMHYNAFAAKGIANNVMQHKGSFRRCHVC